MIWRMPVTDPVLFLTFDDGPVPEITPQILGILKSYNAKATFFCLGENVKKHPDIFRKILDDGHAIGNHTFNHLNGWKTKTDLYLNDVAKCHELLKLEVGSWKSEDGKLEMENTSFSEFPTPDSQLPAINLFRPPYGKVKRSQVSQLKSKYKIVMWDLLSKDYDEKISGEKCFQNVINHARKGSIIVFHDSLKAKERVEYALPKVLDYFSERKFSFKLIGIQ